MVKTERLMSYAAIIFLFVVFGFAFVTEATKKPETWTIKVFDSQIKDNPKLTYVYSYGQSYRVFEGEYTFLADHTYKIIYQKTSAVRGKILSFAEVL
jgi:hypothetical protein